MIRDKQFDKTFEATKKLKNAGRNCDTCIHRRMGAYDYPCRVCTHHYMVMDYYMEEKL